MLLTKIPILQPPRSPLKIGRGLHTSIRLIPWLFLLTAAIGCNEKPAHTVVLFAGSSMTEVLQEIETAFESAHPEINLEPIFAGSQTLAMQINEGAPADLFVSANIEQIHRIKGFTPPKVLVSNQIVAITPSHAQVATLTDAIHNADRIVIAHRDVPAGHYARRALTNLNLWIATEPKIVSYEHTVRSVLTKVAMGEADLGFVYKTDALIVADQVRVIEIPAAGSPDTHTWIAMRSSSPAQAQLVYEFITAAPEALQIFTRFGFTIPPIPSVEQRP